MVIYYYIYCWIACDFPQGPIKPNDIMKHDLFILYFVLLIVIWKVTRN